jgi:hypothetical protein
MTLEATVLAKQGMSTHLSGLCAHRAYSTSLCLRIWLTPLKKSHTASDTNSIFAWLTIQEDSTVEALNPIQFRHYVSHITLI